MLKKKFQQNRTNTLLIYPQYAVLELCFLSFLTIRTIEP